MMLTTLLLLVAIQTAKSDGNCTAEYSCANCVSVRMCEPTATGFKELFTFYCPSSHPYCDVTGSCSTLPSLKCASTDTFPCPQEGVFPHPTDCQKFRVCQNGTSHLFQCPTFYNFDSSQSTCVNGAACYTFGCSGKSGYKVPYPNDHNIYAYCINESPVLVERCMGAYQLDINTQSCAPACASVGSKIPDASNCTKYFYCSKEPYATVYTVTNEQCPLGFGFDPRYLRCVPLKVLPSCQAGS